MKPDKLKDAIITIAIYIILCGISLLTSCLFDTSFSELSSANKIFRVLVELPIAHFICGGLLNIIIQSVRDNVLDKFENATEFNISLISFIMAITIISYIVCRPSVTDYQYYVNIYNEYENSASCITGYVDIFGDEQAYYVEALYFNDNTKHWVSDSEDIYEIDYSNDRYWITLENGNEYEIEFMKRKSD